MGNRATVIFTDGKTQHSPAIYLHWNGGPESIYGFLAELDRRQVRADQEYEAARFVQLVGEFFDQDRQGGLSLGIVSGPAGTLTAKTLNAVQTDHGDNGFYLVRRTGDGTVMRRFTERAHGSDYTLEEMPTAEVEQERLEAESHAYAAEFRAFYLKLAGQRGVEAA